MKNILVIILSLLALYSRGLLAVPTSPDFEGDRLLPYKVGEENAMLAGQEYPDQDQIDKANEHHPGNHQGVPERCHREAGASNHRSDVACDLDQFNTTFANQEVPVVPKSQRPKKIKNSTRGQNLEEFMQKNAESATETRHPSNDGVTH